MRRFCECLLRNHHDRFGAFSALVLISGLAVVPLAETAAQQSREIVASDGFPLHALIWAQEDESAEIVLLLHQCDSDQSMYSQLAQNLFERGFHVVTCDYRGYGKSVNRDFNLATSTNVRAMEDKIREHDRADLDAIMKFCLKLNEGAHSISLLGASCGGEKVLYLVEKYSDNVNAYGIFSSRMPATSVDKIKKFAGKPAIFIAAEQDRRAFAAAQSGFALSTSEHSLLLGYKGVHHGNALFRHDSSLERRIADWYGGVVLPKK